MKTVQWRVDTQVREGLEAHKLIDQDGTLLARVCDSTNTFRKAGDYSLTAWSEITLSGEGRWSTIKTVLVHLFPDHDLADLELPARVTPQTLPSRADHLALR